MCKRVVKGDGEGKVGLKGEVDGEVDGEVKGEV